MTKKIRVNDLDPDAEGVLNSDSISALEGLNVSHATTVLDACEWLWKYRELDGEFAVTHETLNEFDASRIGRWNKLGKRSVCTINGKPAVYYENMQSVKGGRRRSLLVIDLDGICLAITKW